MSSTHDELENLAQNLEKRRPVFVTETGEIHDAEKLGQRSLEGDHGPATQLKATTWFI
jgi:hypothetical protein